MIYVYIQKTFIRTLSVIYILQAEYNGPQQQLLWLSFSLNQHFVSIMQSLCITKIKSIQLCSKQYFKGYSYSDLIVFINTSDVIEHKFIAKKMFQSKRPVFGHIFMFILKLLEISGFRKKCLMPKCVLQNMSQVIIQVRLAL